MVLLSVILVLASIILTIALYIRKKLSYWSAGTNVPVIKPNFSFGKGSADKKRKQFNFALSDYYNEMKGRGPFGGIFLFLNPVAIALDLDFIKNVLIKDFNHFHDRGLYYNEKSDPISATLVAIDGHKWRNIRTKLTPTFTSGKMKFMFPTIVDVGKQFEKCVSNTIKENETIEIKDISARFTTDVIGTCAFGIECNSLSNPNAEFRRMGKKVFDTPSSGAGKRLFMITFKRLAKFFDMTINSQEIIDFFVNIVKDTISFREKNDIKRNDFMDLLIELKNRGSVGAEDSSEIKKTSKSVSERGFTLNEISAQTFVFFLAGFETSSTTMTFCLYELAVNRDIQTKLRNEIRKTMEKHNGELTYEAVMDMEYLDQVINETLRKYPPVGSLLREVTKDYYVPQVRFTLKKGMMVMIPVFAIHHNPEYYPEPERFDPNRFTPEEVKKRNPMTFLPFGDGPRNCIGMRFGFMQTRIGIITLLNKFEISVSAKTQVPLVFSQTALVLAPDGGMHLNVKEIK